MPGGKCSVSLDGEFEPAARCGLLSVNAAGVSMKLHVGGVAEAYFPEKSEDDLKRLQPGEKFTVEWEKAVFYGKHWLLGSVIARLDPSRHVSNPQSSVAGSENKSGGFFPAVNRNYLVFDLFLPRFGIVMSSSDPIVNEAEINEIPPYNSIYELQNPVKYNLRKSGLFSDIFSIKIEKCAVKLVELKNIHVNIVFVESDRGNSIFDVTFTNETTEENIDVSWLIWPEPSPEIYDTISLTRVPRTERIVVPEQILRDQRWLTVAIAKPFSTDAAQAARFPS